MTHKFYAFKTFSPHSALFLSAQEGVHRVHSSLFFSSPWNSFSIASSSIERLMTKWLLELLSDKRWLGSGWRKRDWSKSCIRPVWRNRRKMCMSIELWDVAGRLSWTTSSKTQRKLKKQSLLTLTVLILHTSHLLTNLNVFKKLHNSKAFLSMQFGVLRLLFSTHQSSSITNCNRRAKFSNHVTI